jgi:adenosylhomocysteine nucleosidase
LSETGIIVAAVGLHFEARIAEGPGIVVLGRDPEGGLSRSMKEVLRAGCRGLISFGIAGGLAAHLRPGTFVVASGIADGETIWPTCPDWSARLLAAIPDASHALIAGSDSPVAHPRGKKELHAVTGAVAVDMESHLAARLASEHAIPFAALRVVADPAHRRIPQAALVGMRPDGSTNVPAVLRSLGRHPKSLPALLHTAADVAIARASLSRGRRQLGPRFGFYGEEITPRSPAAFPALRPA